MNVIRMVKMFGWERKIQSRIDEKREAELKWVWKARVSLVLFYRAQEMLKHDIACRLAYAPCRVSLLSFYGLGP
jgi:hypothetical protein